MEKGVQTEDWAVIWLFKGDLWGPPNNRADSCCSTDSIALKNVIVPSSIQNIESLDCHFKIRGMLRSTPPWHSVYNEPMHCHGGSHHCSVVGEINLSPIPI